MSKIVFLANHQGGISIFHKIIEMGIKPSFVVTISPEKAAMHKVSGYHNFITEAEKYHIPVYQAESFSLNTENDIDFFRKERFDLLVQGGWQRLIPEEALKTFGIGALGYHGSSDFLPKGRGRSPMNWSLIEGKKRFIMHLFLMKPEADNGDVIDFIDFDITPWDDIETMYIKYGMSIEILLERNLHSILAGNFTVHPQSGEPSYYPKRTEADGLINWEKMDVYEIYNLVRATTRPYPGAYAYLDGKKIKIWRVRILDTRLKYFMLKPGDIIKQFNNQIIVNCLGGLLLIDDFEFV